MTSSISPEELITLKEEGLALVSSSSPSRQSLLELNLRVLVATTSLIANSKLGRDELLVLRSLVESSIMSLVNQGGASDLDTFVDDCLTFSLLFIGPSNNVMYPDACTTDTFEVLALILGSYLIHKEFAPFELLSKLVKSTNDGKFQEAANGCDNLQKILQLHVSLSRGSLEASLRLVENAMASSCNIGFSRVCDSIGEMLRQSIAASIERSFKQLRVSKVLEIMHLPSEEALHLILQKRATERKRDIEELAFPMPGIAENSDIFKILSAELEADDLMRQTHSINENVVEWKMEGDTIFFTTLDCNEEASRKESKLTELRNIQNLLAFGEFMEDTF
eukprot:GHVH01006946.1.p1 GENE.GHVH01006946.1~~GHVH01006946.1.p1  ORF type:complete len:336 (+),score=52.57 GHVH01006946.1:154-1161(+)